ncbi:MAG: hypothetical protein NUV61_03545 [Candidatus Azambacteria bacterium]|nr:hypothetical protein [Candidatus Azambacteria bacterium]
MQNAIKIKRVIDDGSKEEKEIYELPEDSSRYCLLGKAIGINMNHCIILGSKHKNGFWHRVYGYRIIQNWEIEKMMFEAMKKIRPEIEPYITVAFFERLT